MSDSLAHVVTSFAILLLVFLPLERLFAASKQGILRLGFWADLCYFLGQYLLWNAPVVFLITWGHAQLDLSGLTSVRAEFASWPWALQFVAAMLLSDLLGTSLAAQQRVLVALPPRASHRRTHGLAGCAPRTSTRQPLHAHG